MNCSTDLAKTMKKKDRIIKKSTSDYFAEKMKTIKSRKMFFSAIGETTDEKGNLIVYQSKK